MRFAKLTWMLATVAAVGACQSQARGPNALKRPDVGQGYTWAGDAIPTGDTTTSVLSLEKIVPSDLHEGQTCAYSIRVANITKSTPLANVVVTDDTSESGFRFESSQPAGMRSGDKIVWNLGAMQPGTSAEIRVSGRAGAMGQAPCCSTVTYGEVARPKPTPAPVAAPTAVVAPVLTAQLDLTMSAPAEVCVYDDIPIRFLVKNTGKGQAKDVKVTGDLPDGWTVNGQKTVNFNVGTLEAGASKELSAKARSSRTGRFVDNATATAAGGLTAAAKSDTNVHKAVLEITKSAAKPTVILGRPATFTVTVKNSGDWVAEGCTIKDTMTGADSVGAVSDGGTASGSTVTWSLGNIAPGASRSVTVTASRASAGTIENAATASAKCSEPVSGAASVKFIGIPAVLLELADNPDPVAVGGTTTYTIKVTNQGTAPDSDIVITCSMEDAVEFVSAAGATTGTNAGSKVTFAPLATLKPKEVAVWTVVVKGVKAADSRFTVELNTHETGRPIVSNEATRIYE